jgi:hypothetical protein
MHGDVNLVACAISVTVPSTDDPDVVPETPGTPEEGTGPPK